MNSYQLRSANDSIDTGAEVSQLQSKRRNILAVIAWGTGTFFLALLVAIDTFLGTKLPGGMIYVAAIVGPVLGICGAIATRFGTRGKILLIVSTICLLPTQFVIIGLVSFATTGFDGIH